MRNLSKMEIIDFLGCVVEFNFDFNMFVEQQTRLVNNRKEDREE